MKISFVQQEQRIETLCCFTYYFACYGMEIIVSALLLIDIQNDYFVGGKFELNNPLKALKNAEKEHR